MPGSTLLESSGPRRIFFCQNNQWAISLPRERQTRSATLAEKAEAYGFPGVVVDGNDLEAVYRSVSEARLRAVAGEGPTLIEAQVYRLGPHSTSDDPHRYRADAEVAEARHRDPLHRLRAELIVEGGLDEAADQKLWDSKRVEVARTIEGSEQVPALDPTTIFDDVFEVPTPRLEEERAAYESAHAHGGLKP